MKNNDAILTSKQQLVAWKSFKGIRVIKNMYGNIIIIVTLDSSDTPK